MSFDLQCKWCAQDIDVDDTPIIITPDADSNDAGADTTDADTVSATQNLKKILLTK